MNTVYVWVLLVTSFGTASDPREFATSAECLEAGVQIAKYVEDQVLCVPKQVGGEE